MLNGTIEAVPETKRQRPEPETGSDETQSSAMHRCAFWIGIGVLTVVWSLAVYLPDRQRLDRAEARRAELVHEIKSLWYEVTRLSKGEQALRDADPYLWEQVIQMRLKGLGIDPEPTDKEPADNVR